MTMQAITKAVFPVAGLGTRFLPATKATPKEMLPIIDKPLVQYAVEEAYQAGIREFIFITGRSKGAIADHFDLQPEIESELQQSNKNELLAILKAVTPRDAHYIFTRQSRPRGLGDAVCCAQSLIAPNESFAVLLADDYLLPQTPSLATTTNSTLSTMIQSITDKSIASKPAMAIACEEVDLADTKKYGIVKGSEIASGVISCSKIIEKPNPEQAPSRMGVIGRYVLPQAIFSYLQKQAVGTGGEVQLTDAIAAAMADGIDLTAYQCSERRFDCGSKVGYLQATIATALADEDLRKGISQFLTR